MSKEDLGAFPRKIAVSLEYAGAGTTPILTAKGEGDFAHEILEEARRQGIYIAEDARLANALSALDPDQPIPEELFTAVAIVLSWSYWLRGLEP